MKDKSDEKKRIGYGGFQYAFAGIITCIRQERNMRMHCVMTILVILAGTILGLSAVEWCISLILCGLILALEMVNTAIEAVVDLATEEKKPLAKIAKDTAAGAVFVMAIMAAAAGCIIFIPKILAFLNLL